MSDMDEVRDWIQRASGGYVITLSTNFRWHENEGAKDKSARWECVLGNGCHVSHGASASEALAKSAVMLRDRLAKDADRELSSAADKRGHVRSCPVESVPVPVPGGTLNNE